MNHLRSIATLAVLLWAAVAPAQPVPRHELSSLVSNLPHASAAVGACVIDLTSGEVVFAHEADRLLTPASTMKIFTMAAALLELGPEFAFETRLATDGFNLILLGDGDPALGDARVARRRGDTPAAEFERWAAFLAEAGIRSFPGGLIVDDGIFDREWVHPAWESEDLGKWYAAPVAGLNFNDNCVDITLTPTTAGAPPTVSIFPPSDVLTIVNQCRTGGKGQPILRHPAGTHRYEIDGGCSRKWTFGPTPFADPPRITGDALRAILRDRGVGVAGEVTPGLVRRPDGTLPPSAEVIATTRTPIAEVLSRVGKDSQNLFAECLLKRTGYSFARRRGRVDARGSWPLGAEAIRDTVSRLGIDAQGLVVSDGSGLSRENACTARQLAAVLARMHARPEGKLLRESLSIAGVDGSMKSRLKDTGNRIAAKTGTMRGIRGLAGYVDGTDGGYAFAIVFNGYKGGSAPYKDIQDRFCRILAQSRPRPDVPVLRPDDAEPDPLDDDAREQAAE